MRQKTKLTPTSDVKKRETTEDEFLFSNKKKFDPSGRWKIERFPSEIKANLYPEHVTARTCFSILLAFVVYCICQPVVTFFVSRTCVGFKGQERGSGVFFFFSHMVKNIPCDVFFGVVQISVYSVRHFRRIGQCSPATVLQRREVELDHPALVCGEVRIQERKTWLFFFELSRCCPGPGFSSSILFVFFWCRRISNSPCFRE